MAVGDSINVNMSTTNAFQPASGVEIMVLYSFFEASSGYVGFQDGTLITSNHHPAADYNQWLDCKFPITNTNYYYNNSLQAQSGFAGIQIK